MSDEMRFSDGDEPGGEWPLWPIPIASFFVFCAWYFLPWRNIADTIFAVVDWSKWVG
jgi:hypothetical protein